MTDHLPSKGTTKDKVWLGMETPGDSWILTKAMDAADVIGPWLPRWLAWVLSVPFVVIFVLLLPFLEFAVRWLVTPRRYWERP
jgi:hypothetical protein